MFTKYIIDNQLNIFEELSGLTEFEDTNNGRMGAILVDLKDNFVPVVRSTSPWNKAAQLFSLTHHDIIDKIKKISKIEKLELNNAMTEIYNSNYRHMKFHSDNSLDLADNSHICLFSCYDKPTNIRKLIIKEKGSIKCSEILLEHNSVIIFSTETNKKYLHKIILDTCNKDNRWLGITFRLSKTFVKFVNEIPYFYPNGNMLTIATKEETREFMKHKGTENLKIGHIYPEIEYTISVGDTLLPIK